MFRRETRSESAQSELFFIAFPTQARSCVGVEHFSLSPERTAHVEPDQLE